MLTSKLRKLLELFLPRRIDLDLLLDGLFILAVEPDLLAVEDEIGCVVWMQGRQD